MSSIRWQKVLTCWNWLYKEYSQSTATLDPAGEVPVDATQDRYQMTGIQLGETPYLPDGGSCQGPGPWRWVPLACDHVCPATHTGHLSVDVYSSFVYHDPMAQGDGHSLGRLPQPTSPREQMGIQVKYSRSSS